MTKMPLPLTTILFGAPQNKFHQTRIWADPGYTSQPNDDGPAWRQRFDLAAPRPYGGTAQSILCDIGDV